MKTVGPFVAARSLDTGFSGAAQPVKVLHALDRLTGMPALVYLLPQAVTLPELPDTPSLLPYIEVGIQGEQAYVASELPPHAGLASDPLQAALGGLRALNALHEAGLVHGGVGPHQLWEWDGDVRLAGAALPWGEAQGALAAPEGGRSPAADLYALGVTLLRMGPLPAGLSDLLSPYPAQRPSARDALARFNAGPPLPTPPSPLMVQAPLHPREPGPLPTPDAPLPLIADPEQRVAPSSSDPLPSVLLPPAVPAPTPGAEALPDGPVGAAGLPVFDWEEVDSEKVPESGGPHAAGAEPAGSGSAELQAAEVQPVEIGTAGTVTVIGAGSPTAESADAAPTAAPPDTSPVSAPPDATGSELLNFLAAFPTPDAPPQTVPADARLADAPSAGPPQAAPALDPAAQVAEAEVGPLVFSGVVPQPVIADPSAQPAPPDRPAPGAAPARSSRQLTPVKIGWSQDGAWQVKKGSGGVAAAAAGTPPPGPADGPPSFVRSPKQNSAGQNRGSRSSANRFNSVWLLALALVVAVLVVVLVQRGVRSGGPAGSSSSSGCCTVTAQLVGSSGQGLSAPVSVSVLSAPAESRLKSGTLIGQAPGPLTLDTPGSYALKVVGDGYAAQTVNVTVPTTQPLVIKLR